MFIDLLNYDTALKVLINNAAKKRKMLHIIIIIIIIIIISTLFNVGDTI